MEIICCALLSYFIGTISPSYLIAASKGVDIRKRGSGNAGASNVMIVFGKSVGAICAILDIAKACLAIWAAQTLFPELSIAFSLAAAMCILGHIFPFYMKFKGGKGLACLGGVILMYSGKLFIVMLLLEFILAFVVDYICVVPMSASVAFSVIYGILDKDVFGMLLLLAVSVVIFMKHMDNLKRIRKGQEVHFSYLWNKEAEIARIKENGATEGK